MGLLSKIRSWFSAAEDVSQPLPAMQKAGGVALPSFLQSAKPGEGALPAQDLQLANTDITSLRYERKTWDSINKFIKASPDLGAAVSAAIRMAISQRYKVIARELDGKISVEGTKLAQQFVRRFNLLNAMPKQTFRYPTIRALSEALARELLAYGSCSAELVLGKNRVPEGIVGVSTTKIQFKSDGKRLIPFQKVGSEEISLDIPTFFYTSLDQDLTQAYSDSPVQAALQPIIAAQDFMNDLRKIFKRAIHPRQAAEIKTEEWKKYVPAEVLHDPDKFAAYMESTTSDLENKLNGLAPEEALVYFDLIKFHMLTTKDLALSDEYKTLSDILTSKQAAGAKTLPAIIGHSSGGLNTASTEAMLFVKTVEGAVQGKLNDLFSRIFTMALRLMGMDVVAEFAFEPVNLRPETELEAFYAMKQSRVLELLSLGLISDEEASIELTGTLPEAGAPGLSGTFFTFNKANVENPNSNTSALNRTLKPDTPQEPKSQNQGK